MAIGIYDAIWRGDCKQTKNTLEELGAKYMWRSIETEDRATDRAVAISDQQHIPAMLYPDGTFQVESSVVGIKSKLDELNIK